MRATHQATKSLQRDTKSQSFYCAVATNGMWFLKYANVSNPRFNKNPKEKALITVRLIISSQFTDKFTFGLYPHHSREQLRYEACLFRTTENKQKTHIEHNKHRKP